MSIEHWRVSLCKTVWLIFLITQREVFVLKVQHYHIEFDNDNDWHFVLCFNRDEQSFSLVLPIHMRYQDPSTNSTHRVVSIQPPLVFTLCAPSTVWKRVDLFTSSGLTQEVHGMKMLNVHDKYEDLVLHAAVPVGETQWQAIVTSLTLSATILASALIIYQLWWQRDNPCQPPPPHED